MRIIGTPAPPKRIPSRIATPIATAQVPAVGVVDVGALVTHLMRAPVATSRRDDHLQCLYPDPRRMQGARGDGDPAEGDDRPESGGPCRRCTSRAKQPLGGDHRSSDRAEQSRGDESVGETHPTEEQGHRTGDAHRGRGRCNRGLAREARVAMHGCVLGHAVRRIECSI